MQATHRRTRIPLSCELCRTRKLKCNRETPCQNCTARGEQDACNYRGHKDPAIPVGRRKGDEVAIRQRVDQLERLVRQLLSNRGLVSASDGGNGAIENVEHSHGEPFPGVLTEGAIPAAAGKTVLGRSHSIYHGSNDWHTVLQEIGDLKGRLHGEQRRDSDYMFENLHISAPDGSGLLFTQAAPVERMEMLSSLPPRSEVDRLVAWYFDVQSFPIPVPPIIHEPTLRRELDRHWQDPFQADLIWLGLVFSILGITMLAYHQHGEPPEYEGRSETLFQLYRTRTGQCLQRGDISKCLPYTVEALRLNATAELHRKDDNRRALWMTTGVIVRAAVNMGYHHDPASDAMCSLSAEYRRRVWLSVISMDNMASFQLDFPRTMPKSFSNTKEPLNVHDWELSERTEALPPARPLSELTPVTYLIAKGRLYNTLGRITDLNSGLQLGSYDTVLDIDHALQKGLEDAPPYVKAVLCGDHEPASITANFSAFSLLHAYYLGMCVLHRRFMAKSKEDARFSLSRERCVSCSISLLSFQRNLDPKYYKISRTRQTFALAAMLLFLEVELRKDDTKHNTLPESHIILETLEISVNSWAAAMHLCQETWSIYDLLVRMIAACRTWASMLSFLGHAWTPVERHYTMLASQT
ncbi:uncharacterized protein CC84DRAFT_1198217 [Paraphaeosphaeria sporulosa]|uniref:Zn(2)-C6 fungal-type domain-containing protein n=1 Tax=Paraphaeosphaeria sporulosa TaxID=1460663 RepID=A0A177C6S5_9PLEO|nr:uncharacterized protein CC84DRAFT_1198217 [Paraphaeosphaeria sporulosa]OAG03343.1 hypothetical protein CC84DRAFT_1198217 [Paraphaeosphaeria sporulosa]